MSVTVRPMAPERRGWLAERAGLSVTPALVAIEAVREDGTTIAAVGFDGWLGNSCMMHVALEYPTALRHILKPGFGIAFAPKPVGLGFAAVYAPVRDDNRAALLMVEHLGFKPFHHGKDWVAPGVGMVLFEMRRGDCRWLEA